MRVFIIIFSFFIFHTFPLFIILYSIYTDAITMCGGIRVQVFLSLRAENEARCDNYVKEIKVLIQLDFCILNLFRNLEYLILYERLCDSVSGFDLILPFFS